MKHRLELLAAAPIEIKWHENSRVYFSVKKEKGRLHFRLHRLFDEAPTPVLEALLRYAATRDKKAKSIIRQMAHLYFSKNQVSPKYLPHQGRVYDLKEILERILSLQCLSDIDFAGPMQGPAAASAAGAQPFRNICIGWSGRRSVGRLRSITFGTFDPYACQIRIHPILDDSEVPLYFLEYIVYHEFLHAVYPVKMGASGRCFIHTKEFREKERQFPRFLEAKLWEKQSIRFFKKRLKSGRS